MTTEARVAIRRALISVSDKTGILDFARRARGAWGRNPFHRRHRESIARRGPVAVDDVARADRLSRDDGRPGQDPAPEDPRRPAGAARQPEHAPAMAEHGIEPIDLVVVNLYPFEASVAKAAEHAREAIENIDIGGPSMLRSAAKNYRIVAVVDRPSQYDRVCRDLDGPWRRHDGWRCARPWRAQPRTAALRRRHRRLPMHGRNESLFPQQLVLRLTKTADLRLRREPAPEGSDCTWTPTAPSPSGGPRVDQLHGIQLGFLQSVRRQRRLELVKADRPRPAGGGGGDPARQPVRLSPWPTTWSPPSRAYAGDPLAAFGGIVALNRRAWTRRRRATILERQFVEVLIAARTTSTAALAILRDARSQRCACCASAPAADLG